MAIANSERRKLAILTHVSIFAPGSGDDEVRRLSIPKRWAVAITAAIVSISDVDVTNIESGLVAGGGRDGDQRKLRQT